MKSTDPKSLREIFVSKTNGVSSYHFLSSIDNITHIFGSIDDACVVAELEHSKHWGKDGIAQEEGQPL